MEDIIHLIKTRRNVEEFLPRPIEWDKVSKVLDAGRHAPSSGNLQNWRFIVVWDPGLRHEIADISMEQFEIGIAPIHIVVVGEPEKVEKYYGLRGRNLYSIQNCAAAIQNMLLEAHSLGLGTRWIGGFEEEKLKGLLGIPPEGRPQAIIVLGYPARIPEKPPKYPMESVVYLNKWRNRLKDVAKYLDWYSDILARNLGSMKEQIKKVAGQASTAAQPKVDTLAKKVRERIKERLAKKGKNEEIE